MDKKDIYEHLAKIYLDASSKKKKKTKDSHKFRNLFFASLAVITILGLFSFTNIIRSGKPVLSKVALVLYPDIVRINFNFDPAKKEVYDIDLNKLNLTRYKSLVFSIKKTNYKDSMYLKIEWTNIFNEKSSIYLKDIQHKWKEYELPFSDFKDISDWSEMSSLAFIVEEWNAQNKRDIILLDNIRVVK